VRLVAVGDTGQLDAVQLPGLFSEICRVAPTVELTDIRRHRDPDDPGRTHPWLTRYQAALHDGDGRSAVALLQEHDAVRLHDTRPEAMVALVDDWNTWRHEHPLEQSMLLVHGTNGDVDTVNVLAQHRRRDGGELGDQAVPAPDRDYQLHVGDRLVLRGAPLRLPTGTRIENGTTMDVLAVDARSDQLTVRLPDGNKPTIDLKPLRHAHGDRRPALRLAYAMHPSPAQGATVARTAALGHPVADRNATYVADTRARYGHKVHLAREDLGTDGTDEDRLARYAETISASRSRDASTRYRREQRRIGRDL
jgi:hypothetical protein